MADQDCSNCVPATQVTDLKEQFNEFKRSVDERFMEQGRRLGDVERRGDVNEEQTKMIFKMLIEIKASIEDLKNKPAKRWENVVSTVITVAVTMGLTYLLTKR